MPEPPASGPPAEHRAAGPARLRFAILTMSDSRRGADDRSGALLEELARGAGHDVRMRAITPDEPEEIAKALNAALDAADVDVLVTTGGTGLSARDVAPETIEPRLEKTLPGFGEIFRALSFQEVGSAAMASRASAGSARGKLVFVLPGSPAACRLAMERLILPEAPHLVGVLSRSRGASSGRAP